MEIWKDIKGYEGYLISNYGRIISFKRHKEGIELKPSKNKQGYMVVGLRTNDRTYQEKVHRLVAKAFIPNPDNKPCIDHINTLRDDNRSCNLRWCTIMENNQNPITKAKCDASKIGRQHTEAAKNKMSESRKGKAPSEAAIQAIIEKLKKTAYQYTLDGEFVRCFSPVRECEKYGFNSANVSKCCNGITQHYKGYRWSYEPLHPL